MAGVPPIHPDKPAWTPAYPGKALPGKGRGVRTAFGPAPSSAIIRSPENALGAGCLSGRLRAQEPGSGGEEASQNPPDKQEKATQTVLEQAEALSEMWAVS
jgi:hypothetical protein